MVAPAGELDSAGRVGTAALIIGIGIDNNGAGADSGWSSDFGIGSLAGGSGVGVGNGEGIGVSGTPSGS